MLHLKQIQDLTAWPGLAPQASTLQAGPPPASPALPCPAPPTPCNPRSAILLQPAASPPAAYTQVLFCLSQPSTCLGDCPLVQARAPLAPATAAPARGLLFHLGGNPRRRKGKAMEKEEFCNTSKVTHG